MIRNNYVFELPNFDTKELFKFVSKQIPDNWYMMDDDKIVCNYDSQYSWLGNRFNIYQLKGTYYK